MDAQQSAKRASFREKSPDMGNRGSTRHNLPQMSSQRGKNPRMAMSKSSAEQSYDAGQINIVPMDEMKERNDRPPQISPRSRVTRQDPADMVDMPPPDIPTPPTSETMSDESPNTPRTTSSSGSKSPSVSPPTPIKLKIRRTAARPADGGDQEVPPLETSLSVETELGAELDLGESPPSGMRRTKTKGQIKKQLQKKKGQKAEGLDPNSGASTPKSEPQEIVLSKQQLPPVVPVLPVTPAVVPKLIMPRTPQTPGLLEPHWLVGDMLLGRVPTHPYWPCMVAYHPYESIYTKIKGKTREYHVQFFGNEGERGWVNYKNLIEYEGQDAFEQWCALMRQKCLKKDIKIYMVAPKRRKAWDVAIKEANVALPLSRQERKQTFTFQYKPPPGKAAKITEAEASSEVVPVTSAPAKNKSHKRKLDDSVSGTPSATTPPPKRQKRIQSAASGSGESDPDLSPSHIKIPAGLADQNATQFMVFCQKKRDLLHREHPGYGLQQISDILTTQWEELSQEERSKYIPMGSDVTHLSQIMSQNVTPSGRSSRGSKPSKKKLEADQSFDFLAKKKHKTPLSPVSKASMSPPMSTVPAVMNLSPLDSVIETINSVAAGAGTVKEVIQEPVIVENLQEPAAVPTAEPPKKVTKKKTETPDIAAVEPSSPTSSVKDDQASSKPKPPRLPGNSGAMDYELEVFRLNNTCHLKKEHICHICEEPGNLIQCEGPCNGTYHLSCLGLTVPPAGAFRCDECGSGRHTCFVCKESGNSTRRCGVAQCGRYYHEDCIQKFPLTRMEKNNLVCPLHTCATCAAENPKGHKISKGRMYRCVRCPTAYHASDHCIAAGSINLASLHIICSRHFQPHKNFSHHTHLNVSWCFMCAQGGTLLCCESCPASFHAECLKIQTPNNKWYCSDCARGKRPLYGEIVWGKVGSYRWWPGEICQPKHVPLNIQDRPHQVGEFPMRFFGTHDYYWTHQARVFLFNEGDKGSRDKTHTSNLAQQFFRAVQEATMAYKLWCKAKEKKEEDDQVKDDRKPAPYKHIKVNYPIGSVQIYKPEPSELPHCDCSSDQDNPCGVDTECLNRMMLYECHPSVCKAGDKCQNMRFLKRDYPNAKPAKTTGRGWGLVTQVSIRKSTFINEYVGDLIDEEECKRRVKEAHDNDITNYYMLTLDSKRVIDAGPKGNYSRFMNHSCQPNCETQKWNVNGDVRVGLFASEDILAGSELTFNYNLECLGNEKTICQCGAPNCSGFLGVRPKTAAALDTEKKMKDRKKKKRKHNIHKVHEDECYRCGEGGELVMCDKSNCPKVYHLKCLKLAKLPHGKWICPWHHCDECGKRVVKLCSECPNSFCQYHLEGNIFQIPEEKLVCADHSDLLNAVELSRLMMIPNDPTLSVPSSDVTSESSVLSDGGESTTSHDEISFKINEDVTAAKDVCVRDGEKDNGGIKPEDLKKGVRDMLDASRRSSRAGSGYSDSDMSEGRLCIVEDHDTTLTFSNPESNSQKKRGRPKKPMSVSSPLLFSGEEPLQTQGNSVKSPVNLVSLPTQGVPPVKRVRKPTQELLAKKNGKTKGRHSRSNSLVDGRGDSPMFDDDEDEEFGDLVIDIPTM